MTEDREHVAEAAQRALEGLLVGSYYPPLSQLTEMATDFTTLGEYANAHEDAYGRLLLMLAHGLQLVANGTVAEIVKRIAATLPPGGGA